MTESLGVWLNNTSLLWTIIFTISVLLAVLTVILIRTLKNSRKAGRENICGFPAMQDSIQIANIQGMGQRDNQQDSFAVTDVNDYEKGVCAVVADGMGGTTYGAEASRILTSHIINAFKSMKADSYDPVAFLHNMILRAQDEVRLFIEANGNQIGGTTAVAAIVKDGELFFTSVGDSRICLMRSGGLVQLNREHVYSAQGESQNTSQQGALTSYIGLDGLLEIDCNMTPIRLMSGDRVILMSDGVFGVLSDEEIAEAAGIPDIQSAGASLEERVKVKSKLYQDNFTAIIISI